MQLWIGNAIFRLETSFLAWKQTAYITSKVCRSATQFLDFQKKVQIEKNVFQIKDATFTLEMQLLDWKEDFQIEHTIFHLENAIFRLAMKC